MSQQIPKYFWSSFVDFCFKTNCFLGNFVSLFPLYFHAQFDTNFIQIDFYFPSQLSNFFSIKVEHTLLLTHKLLLRTRWMNFNLLTELRSSTCNSLMRVSYDFVTGVTKTRSNKRLIRI